VYNRYIRNDRGIYARVPEEERRVPPDRPEADSGPPPRVPPGGEPPPLGEDAVGRLLRRLLDRFHLENVDTGDLLLLLLLFLLFEEDADEELLFALGLLLIL